MDSCSNEFKAFIGAVYSVPRSTYINSAHCGSILIFDKVSNPEYPRETDPLEEVFGSRNIEL